MNRREHDMVREVVTLAPDGTATKRTQHTKVIIIWQGLEVYEQHSNHTHVIDGKVTPAFLYGEWRVCDSGRELREDKIYRL